MYKVVINYIAGKEWLCLGGYSPFSRLTGMISRKKSINTAHVWQDQSIYLSIYSSSIYKNPNMITLHVATCDAISAPSFYEMFFVKVILYSSGIKM